MISEGATGNDGTTAWGDIVAVPREQAARHAPVPRA
jgi:hypothetical protein